MTITFVDLTQSNGNESITLPATILANDFLIVQCAYDATPTTPAGWTLLGTRTAAFNDANQAVFYRVADGTEDGTSVLFDEGAGPIPGYVERACLQYRGVDTSAPIEDWATDWGSGGSGAVDGPAITRSAASSVVVGLMCVWSGSYSPAPLTAELSDTSEPMAVRYYAASSSANTLYGVDSLTGVASPGGLVVGFLSLSGSASSGNAPGEGPIDYTPNPNGRRTFFTLSLKAA